ncbi:hypothetical protein BBJ28_00017889 [Nothophytophthora sp. Chile5]|nr:hypothetical protein BBJ28_00017889 [Nothophytophthora sp. Chile5]
MKDTSLFIAVLLTVLASVCAEGVSDGASCNFTAVIDVANTFYPDCRDLYNVFEESLPVNYTSQLCNNSACMDAMNELRAMGLGDCIIFGTTTLTTDILDQCTDDGSSGWSYALAVLALVLLVVIVGYSSIRIKHWRKKRMEGQMDSINGKMGLKDGPYTAIDLASTRV